jgi:hypothetical protein
MSVCVCRLKKYLGGSGLEVKLTVREFKGLHSTL